MTRSAPVAPSQKSEPSPQKQQAQPAGGNGCPEQLKLDNQLCFALYAAANRMTRAYQSLLAQLGVTYPQYLVLLVLWEHGAQSVGELGQALDLDSGTLTPLLKRMQNAGLVLRERDAGDERRVVISLTAAGVKLREQAEQLPIALACRINMPVEDTVGLRDELKRLRQILAAL